MRRLIVGAKSARARLNPSPIRKPPPFFTDRHAQKKTLIARERDRPDIDRHRRRWRAYQKRVDPLALAVSRRDPEQDQHDAVSPADPSEEAAHHRGVGFDAPLGRKAIAESLKRHVRLLGPRGFKKVPVRHELGSAMAAMSDRLSRAMAFKALQPLDGHRFADLIMLHNAAPPPGGSSRPFPPRRSPCRANLVSTALPSLLASAQPAG